MYRRLLIFVSRSSPFRSIQTMNDGKSLSPLIYILIIYILFVLVRKGLQDLVGAQLVYGHGDRSGSHGQLTGNITLNSKLTPRTIAESYDEAIIPLGREAILYCLSFQ